MEEAGNMILGGGQWVYDRQGGKTGELLCFGSEVTAMKGVTEPGFPGTSTVLIKPSRMKLHCRHRGTYRETHENSQCRARRPTVVPMGKEDKEPALKNAG